MRLSGIGIFGSTEHTTLQRSAVGDVKRTCALKPVMSMRSAGQRGAGGTSAPCHARAAAGSERPTTMRLSSSAVQSHATASSTASCVSIESPSAGAHTWSRLFHRRRGELAHRDPLAEEADLADDRRRREHVHVVHRALGL